ncbi:MAG: outer membrane lipoprotein carrier protein LolA [Candidatus Cryptobacteroides sp.]
MKRLLCILLAVSSVCQVSAGSQASSVDVPFAGPASGLHPQTDAVTSFASRIASGCVSFRYSFVIEASSSSGKVTGDGSVLMQGGAYHLQGSGLEVWCDGISVWTADNASKEVVIETSSKDVLVNPALILADLSGHFSWDARPNSGTFSSQPSRMFVLKPLSKSDMDSLELFFDSNGVELLGGRMSLKDNVSATFFISGLTVGEPQDNPVFTPPSFSADWIVTDLR